VRWKKSSCEIKTRPEHRDEPGGLFIGANMSLFALMNTAPAELLHPLFMQHFSHHRLPPVGSMRNLTSIAADQVDMNTCKHAKQPGCGGSQKKRRQQRRRRNSISSRPVDAAKKKPPYPTKSG